MANLTKRQYEIASWMLDYFEAHCMYPTLEEIGAQFGISKVTAHEHIEKMRMRKSLIKIDRRHRGFYLTGEAIRLIKNTREANAPTKEQVKAKDRSERFEQWMRENPELVERIGIIPFGGYDARTERKHW